MRLDERFDGNYQTLCNTTQYHSASFSTVAKDVQLVRLNDVEQC